MALRDMISDPRTGALVDPNWAEQPDIKPRTDLIDGIALRRPAPDMDRCDTEFYFGDAFDLTTGTIAPPLVITADCTPPFVSVT